MKQSKQDGQKVVLSPKVLQKDNWLIRNEFSAWLVIVCAFTIAIMWIPLYYVKRDLSDTRSSLQSTAMLASKALTEYRACSAALDVYKVVLGNAPEATDTIITP